MALNIAVIFFSDKAEWRAGCNEINRLRFETSHIFQGITEDGHAVFRFYVGRHLVQIAFYPLQVKDSTGFPPRSGIRSGPNRAADPEYIVRLVGRVIRVSVETVRIVKSLPALAS